MAALLPKEMSIIVKGTKMKTSIVKGRMFTIDIISDESDESVEMRLDFDDKKLFCVLSKEEVKTLKASQPNYSINKTTESDSINGVFATKYTVSSEDSLQPFDAWFSEDFSAQKGAWFSAYSDLTGFPIIYDVERYGMMMHAEMNACTKREVNDSEFERDADLKETDFETFEANVQELFDLILN